MSNQIQRRQRDAVAKGSLADIAQRAGQSIAQSFIDVDAIVMVDTSGSMYASDVRPNDHSYTRFKAACDELERLQRDLPGKIAVIAFSDHAEFCPSGFPRMIGAGTAMDAALRFVKVTDGCDIRIVLIGDGEPNAPDETLRIAQTFESKISTIYIGPENGQGREFLRQLAEATGGRATRTATDQMGDLSVNVKNLLTA